MTRRRPLLWSAVALVTGAAAAVPAVTGTTAGPARAHGAPDASVRGVTVLAAASLTDALPAMLPGNRFSFGGSDQLAFQVRQGAPADVFASADVRYPAELYADGLVERPVVFAYNALAVLVPRSNPARIHSVRDLARPGVKLIVGDPSVPVGAYTRTTFGRLGLDAALRNVVSEEPDVRSLVAKVALGEADAGIAYVTDARAARARVRSIAIPGAAQPTIAYSVAVATRARDPAAARAFVRHLLGPDGRRGLVRYGFRVG